MIIVDTSIWVDHFRSPDTTLLNLLRRRWSRLHPFTLGELALGNLPRRENTLADLHDLRRPVVATHDEVMKLLDGYDLVAKGIGYVDLHLLASTQLTQGARLWTRDRRLLACAELLDVDFAAAGSA